MPGPLILYLFVHQALSLTFSVLKVISSLSFGYAGSLSLCGLSLVGASEG